MSRDKVFGVANRYGLDGSGIEFLWGVISAILEQCDPMAHPAPRTMITGSLSRGKAAGTWRGAPTPSSAEVKE